MSAKKDYFMSAYRAPADLARDYLAACEHFGLDRVAMARALLAAVVHAFKRKERLLFPIRLRTYGQGFDEDGTE